MCIRKKIVLIFTFFCVPVSGVTVDTLLVADGSPGPYTLGRFFVDSATIRVSRSDSGFIPPFTYISSVNGLLFSDPVDSGVVLSLYYETDYFGLQKVYSFYEKRYVTSSDTGFPRIDSLPSFRTVTRRGDNLTVSGYKTIGVSVGSFGQLNLEQGLDVRIGGEIRPGTEISAHLNDQGTSLEGTTREISEFDMIYIALNDPKFRIVAGDQFIEWPVRGILEGNKKIKGINVTVSPKAGTVSAFGALAGGNFTVQTWRGDGGQGPYTFTGNGEAGFITPIGGTVKVSVNGVQCKEGPDESYVVDYDLGNLTFTARRLIRPEDLIRAEYEYKMFDYRRTLTGTAASAAVGDSVLSVQGVLWSEIDSKNNPIELALTESNIQALESSGDRPPMDTADYEVNRNDVLTRYASIPLYRKTDTLGGTVFVHTVPDPENPLKNDSLFDVHFTPAPDGCGDYIRQISGKYPDYVYRYVGKCNGQYTPLTPLSAPQRLTSGEVLVGLKTPLVNTTVDVAGQERDKNLFSGGDDDDNLASAAAVTVLAGRKAYDRRSFWVGGSGRFWSSRFDREALSAHERKSSWNDYALYDEEKQRQVWESSAGATPFAGLSSEVTYGQQWTENRLRTDKFVNRTGITPLSWLHLDYDGSLFRHFEGERFGIGHRQNGGARVRFTHHAGGITYRDEWRGQVSAAGAGLVEGGGHYEFIPLGLKEQFTYTEFRSGRRHVFAADDTGSALLWKQSINCFPVSWWRINGVGSWQQRRVRRDDVKQHESTLLVDMNSEMSSSGKAFTTRQHYRTTAEKASRFIQIPTYVGEGRGTHRWDSTMNEYVEDLHGGADFIIRQRDVFDSTNSLRMRKTMVSIDWTFRPPEKKFEGLLGDLQWEGRFFAEEHVDADVDKPSSWMPGYLSLRNLPGEVTPQEKIRFCDLSYRQEASWYPAFNRDLRGRISVTPGYRRIRSYRETGIDGTFYLRIKREKLTLENTTRMYSLYHDDTVSYVPVSDYYLRDVNTTFTQTWSAAEIIDIYFKECLGWARQDRPQERKIRKPIDGTGYVQITPGTVLNLKERGRVEADYTLSYVTVQPDHDYRIAKGFSSGISHLVTVMAGIRIGSYFSLNGSYRGEIFQGRNEEPSQPARHVVSLEVQAFL